MSASHSLKTLSAAAVVLTGANAVVVKPSTTVLGKAFGASAESAYQSNWTCKSWDYTDVSFRDFSEAEIAEQCKSYEGVDEVHPVDIATAWLSAGFKQEACAAAVIVASGESQYIGDGSNTFTMAKTGPSGAWQCDTCRQHGSNNNQNHTYANGQAYFGSCGTVQAATLQDGTEWKCSAKAGCTPIAGATFPDENGKQVEAERCYADSKGTCQVCTAKNVDHCGLAMDGMVGEQCQLSLRNPCINAWALVKTVMFPKYGLNQSAGPYNPGCNGTRTRGNSATLYKSCAAMGADQPVDAHCESIKDTCEKENKIGCLGFSDMYPISAEVTQFTQKEMDCNFIGPFCHWQYMGGKMSNLHSAWKSGGAWNGGNFQQGLPFPQYYFDKFLTVTKGADQYWNSSQPWNTPTDATANLPQATAKVWQAAEDVCTKAQKCVGGDESNCGFVIPGSVPKPSKTTTTTQGPGPHPTKTTTTTPHSACPASQSAHGAQCGGQGWTGPTCCNNGLTCTVTSKWFSGCS